MVPIHADLQIIAGEGRSRARIGMAAGTEGEDAKGATELGTAEGGGFGFAESTKVAGAAFDGGAGDFVGKGGGFGAGALGKGEDMEIGEGEALDEGQGCGVVFFRFA